MKCRGLLYIGGADCHAVLHGLFVPEILAGIADIWRKKKKPVSMPPVLVLTRYRH
jgi:hypothetical protein